MSRDYFSFSLLFGGVLVVVGTLSAVDLFDTDETGATTSGTSTVLQPQEDTHLGGIYSTRVWCEAFP